MKKNQVFIGSSSEALEIAENIASRLEKIHGFSCKIWNRSVFEYNQSFLESLTRASITHDFGLFIATKDDISLIRDHLSDTPRDNVVFEYGLFLGVMGNYKTFLLQEHDCKLPSDLLGYSTPSFKRDFNEEDWNKLSDHLSKSMLEQDQLSRIELLPSTSIAIGYFNSFLRKLCEHIARSEGPAFENLNLSADKIKIELCIPKQLSNDINTMASMYYKRQGLEVDEIGTNRTFPIRFFKKVESGDTIIVDIPTTLNAIRPSINLLLPDDTLGEHPDKLNLEKRELDNFMRTLTYLVAQDDYTKNIVDIIWID